MKIIFSRKGFDSGSGGAPSPIIEGRPISLPIPTQQRSKTTYRDLGLGELVETATNGRISGSHLCHHDPMFEDGRWAFGQTGAAQTHLSNNGVGVGDVFLFFGLFADQDGRDRHHRIFGYLIVENAIALGANPVADDQPARFSLRHPHTLGEWDANNTIYVGPGEVARSANDGLRLSIPGGPVSRWHVPSWLRDAGLTYHGQTGRWETLGTLTVVARGQEFVSDIGDRKDAQIWIESVLDQISSAQCKRDR